MVGISLNCDWGEPVDINNPSDIEAAERYLQFCLGWFANPIYAGDYPQVMKDYIGELSHVFVFNLPSHVFMCASSICVQAWMHTVSLVGPQSLSTLFLETGSLTRVEPAE